MPIPRSIHPSCWENIVLLDSSILGHVSKRQLRNSTQNSKPAPMVAHRVNSSISVAPDTPSPIDMSNLPMEQLRELMQQQQELFCTHPKKYSSLMSECGTPTRQHNPGVCKQKAAEEEQNSEPAPKVAHRINSTVSEAMMRDNISLAIVVHGESILQLVQAVLGARTNKHRRSRSHQDRP